MLLKDSVYVMSMIGYELIGQDETVLNLYMGELYLWVNMMKNYHLGMIA